MARPRQEKSLDGATSTGAGTPIETGGAITVVLFVVANNGDAGSDSITVDIEVSQDGTNWAKLRDETGTQVGQVTASELDDPDGNSDPAGYVTVHGVAAEEIRANLTSYTDSAGGDLTVDAWVGSTSNPDSRYNFRTT